MSEEWSDCGSDLKKKVIELMSEKENNKKTQNLRNAFLHNFISSVNPLWSNISGR